MTDPEFDRLAWAEAEADRMAKAAGPAAQRELRTGQNRHEFAAALEFLRIHAAKSEFHRLALEATDSHWLSDSLRQIALLLDSWVAGAQAGLVDSPPMEAITAAAAATDILEQVDRLLAEKFHPAAPIVLVGAALEEHLRALWHAADSPKLAGKPGIMSYATSLQKAGVLSTQDVKDITAWAGLRNDAAHGDFADLSTERAKLMREAVNFFLARSRS